MEQTTNISPTAATDEPAVLSTPIPSGCPLARVSNRLSDDLVEPALDAGRDVRPGRATRHDGWTPERIRIFLNALAECGVVEDAARAAGMGKTSAYNLRNRARGRAFHVAWDAAEQLARRRLSGELMSRALHGCVELIVRDGQVWGERHRFDNRLTMAVLDRLDRKALASDRENRTARLVAEEFDQFVDLVCAGNGDDAARFVADRVAADSFTTAPEARTLRRCENYARYGVGLPEEIDVADLDTGEIATWTPDQHDRARRSGLLAELAEVDEDDEQAIDDFVTRLVAKAKRTAHARAHPAASLPSAAGPTPSDPARAEPTAAAPSDPASAEPQAGPEPPAPVPEASPDSAPVEPPATAQAEPAPAEPDAPPEADAPTDAPTAEPATEPALEHYPCWVATD